MTSLLYLTPILFAVVLLIFFRKRVVWWEYLILIIPSLLITFLVSLGMISSRTTDTEYYGDYAINACHYDAWDEWIVDIHQETYTDSNGNTQSRTVDNSHRDYHDAYSSQILSNDREETISDEEYIRLKNVWKSTPVFVDMNRDYDINDGDMHKITYNGDIYAAKTVTTTHTYKNKINNAYGIFGFRKIDKDDAKKRGLYDYPDLYSNNDGSSEDQSTIIGYKPRLNELKYWQYINGTLGKKYQVRTFVLFYYNKPLDIVKEQQSYWLGGNKNEIVMCIGVDSISKKIQWVDAFSWCDKPTFEVNFRYFYTGKEKVNLLELANWTEKAIPQYWKRKNFNDFDYIDVELSSTQMIWLFIITIIINLALSIWIILNDVYYNDSGEINNGITF